MMEQFANILRKEPLITVPIICRNLWNFQALNYFNKELFDRFSCVIAANCDKLNELDVANAMSSFAHFEYLNYDCMEGLIKTIIKDATTYKL